MKNNSNITSYEKKGCPICKKILSEHSKSKLIQCKDMLEILVKVFQREYIQRTRLE